jgi:hypothetical protein
LANVDAELEKLSMDAGRAPQGIGLRHICRINSRISRDTLGRPGQRYRLFHLQ